MAVRLYHVRSICQYWSLTDADTVNYLPLYKKQADVEK